MKNITWHQSRRFTRLQVAIQVFYQEDQETEKEDTKDIGEDNARLEPMDMDTKRIGGSFVVIIRDNKTRRKLLWKRQVLISFDNRQKEANVDIKRIDGRKLRRRTIVFIEDFLLVSCTRQQERTCWFITTQQGKEEGYQSRNLVPWFVGFNRTPQQNRSIALSN